MKHTYQALSTALLGLAISIPAFAQTPQPTDDDKKFLATAAQSDQNEMALSKVALQKGSSPGVKKYAKKMISDHTKMTATMKPYAAQWGVTPPTGPDADHQQAVEKLNGLSGTDFDKEYIGQMATDHAKALDAFQDEAKTTQLPKFKATVVKGESVVSAHKTMADEMKNKV